ncbi:restriction endonuclease subunit S [Methylobacterium sp. Leaf456]|uniref:restriction endonuclease subunit S n=1 Tax=Methylobacterium sp. Leaf456 TaxID=1736382 RepID=UPI000B1EEA24|nr:restriction endonuclease subunit S [Methylobacterium sp. Leaf456]
MSASNRFIVLGKIAKLVKRVAHDRRNIHVYSISKHEGFVRSDVYLKKRVHSEDTSNYKAVTPGDFAFSPIHLDEGSIALAFEPALISPMYKVFEVDPSICDKNHLIRVLKSRKMIALYSSLGDESVHRRRSVPFERLSKLKIYLPALDEQRRIAAILERTDALRRKRKRALELLGGLTQSIFLEMFGEPVENIREIPTAHLQDVVSVNRKITYDILKPGPDIADGIPYVRVVDMRDGMIDASALRKTSLEIAQGYKRSTLKSGDLLISIQGHVGRTAITPPECAGANITQDTARPAINGADTEFVKAQLETKAAQDWMARRTKVVSLGVV